MSASHVEIVAIGNELLLGLTEEKNISWLCRTLTRAGAVVEQGCIVPDAPEAISATVRGAILRRAHLVITCGGLGPTEDDQTLAVLAQALNRPLQEDADARRMIERRYRELYEEDAVASPALTPARRKMARLPQGAIPLENTVGTAPGMLVEIDRPTWICALPGPPRENRPMAEEELIPRLADPIGLPLGAYRERHLRADCKDESVLAPLLRQVDAQHPDVYVKSRAAAFEEQHQFRIVLVTRADDVDTAEQRLDATEQTLDGVLGDAGIAVYVEP